MSTRIHIQANQSPEGGVAVFIYDQPGKGEQLRPAKKIEFCKKPLPVGTVLDMAAHIANADAQVLFDELWKAGFRPQGHETEVVMTTAVEKAKDAHMADLKEITLKCLASVLKS